MKYLIIEDEINACEYLRDLLKKLRPEDVMMQCRRFNQLVTQGQGTARSDLYGYPIV